MLRRPRTGTPTDEAVRRFGALSIDPQSREVHLDGVPVELTRTEFDILDALSARPRLAYTRAQLIEAVWGSGWVGDEHLVDIHIGHIRRKLHDDPTNPRYVLTVRGVGYPDGYRMKRSGLGARIFAATGLVVVAGAGTLLAVALLVAPQVFHGHLRMALGSDIPASTASHVDEAFTTAILLSLGMAVVVAVLAALTVAWLVSRRIAAPVADLAIAAGRVAAGGYDARVPDPGLGPEFAALAEGFNAMAARLAATERVRQRMLADLAHELPSRWPSLAGSLPADPTAWSTLTDQAARLSRFVDDIGAVSHAEKRSLYLRPARHDLPDLARAASTAIQARYTAKGVHLVLECAADTPAVNVDADRLGEALANLLDNALRHTPPGGTVRVGVGRGERFGRAVAELAVADTGKGFDPGEAERLFERFYRADPARTRHGSGSGIGLR
jgi:signal transduction histidine kinase